MRPVSYKPKTGRRFRGLEVAQAAILLVLGVAVALAMYYIVTGIVASTPIPPVQLDPYTSVYQRLNDEIIFWPSLKFGRTGFVVKVVLNNVDSVYPISVCFDAASAGYKIPVVPGKAFVFRCEVPLTSNLGLSNVLRVGVVFDDGTAVNILWIP
jgi:hypothetical protein